MWLAPFQSIMGVDAASSRTIGVKTERSTFEWHNFCIRTLLDKLLMPLERGEIYVARTRSHIY